MIASFATYPRRHNQVLIQYRDALSTRTDLDFASVIFGPGSER